MLALLRSTRGAKEVFRNVRPLSTIAPSASSPDTSAEQPDDTAVTRKRRNRSANSSAEGMFVYPWNGIRSSAEGLAIARAVQEKFGTAKEVIFPRDTDNVAVFLPYFWLVFDNADVRERLPEESEQIRIRVTDLPRGDGNVGVEEMVRGLGLSTDKGEPLKPQSSAEVEGSADIDEATDGYRTLDVRVQWAQLGPPGEVIQRRRPSFMFFPNKAPTPDFAAAWLAFDGFSPDAARGAHTPNLFRAREKWRGLASSGDDPNVAETASPVNESASEMEVEPASAEEAGANVNVAREWVPIFPLSPSLTPRPTTVPKSDVDIHTTDDLAVITATAAVDTAAADTAAVAPTSAPSSSLGPTSIEVPTGPKMSRRERILHLARQNAQTPLPELAEQPQAVVEAEKSEGVSEQEEKERTIRERLWRLVGGNY
ncbi:hypothetical protein BJY52DRAFT_1246263 [Lactarius psammicola]|nr:hypothetical protein BJY52DRAFT_1246263 [Lactarius psammicola]